MKHYDDTMSIEYQEEIAELCEAVLIEFGCQSFYDVTCNDGMRFQDLLPEWWHGARFDALMRRVSVQFGVGFVKEQLLWVAAKELRERRER